MKVKRKISAHKENILKKEVMAKLFYFICGFAFATICLTPYCYIVFQNRKKPFLKTLLEIRTTDMPYQENGSDSQKIQI